MLLGIHAAGPPGYEQDDYLLLVPRFVLTWTPSNVQGCKKLLPTNCQGLTICCLAQCVMLPVGLVRGIDMKVQSCCNTELLDSAVLAACMRCMVHVPYLTTRRKYSAVKPAARGQPDSKYESSTLCSKYML